MRQRGFTLLEVIVAMGVLGVGATAAFSLLVAGASAGRRAERSVEAALLAENVLDDLHADLNLALEDVESFPLASGVLPDAEGVNPETRLLVREGTWSAYPDYIYDVALTPLPGPDPDQPWEYLVEVVVRYVTEPETPIATFELVVLRGVTHRDNPAPSGQYEGF